MEIPAQGSKWVPQQSKVVMFPPSEHSVQIGDIVRISHVHKNKLFVQSRETYKLLMCLNDKVKSCEFEPLNVEPVQNQMVFHKCESRDGFCRALIKNIGKNSAEIYYIDYGATAEVPIAKLCKYDETFHKFKTTLSSIDLTNFRVADPSTIMEKLPELKKQKYVVVSDFLTMTLRFQKLTEILEGFSRRLVLNRLEAAFKQHTPNRSVEDRNR